MSCDRNPIIDPSAYNFRCLGVDSKSTPNFFVDIFHDLILVSPTLSICVNHEKLTVAVNLTIAASKVGDKPD